MPRRKNCSKARTLNLPVKHVEEPFSDSEDNEFIPNTSSDEEFSSSDEDELKVSDLKNEADLLLFSETLQAAHNRLIAEQKAKRKRPTHYTKNSERSKKRHRQQRREMERKGFQSIKMFFGIQSTGFKEPNLEPQVREF